MSMMLIDRLLLMMVPNWYPEVMSNPIQLRVPIESLGQITGSWY